MTRYLSGYKDQEVRNTGSGFSGFESVGSGSDSSIRYDFGDNIVSTYSAFWSETGQGLGWYFLLLMRLGI